MTIVNDDQIYAGKIVDQIATRNRDNALQVVFTAEISGKLLSDWNGAVEPVSPFEREVYVTLSNDPQKLRIATGTLEALGFEGSNYLRLHPEHSEFHSMIGKEVRLRRKVKEDKTYWNFAFSRRRPTPIQLAEAEAAMARLKPAIDEDLPSAPGHWSAESPPPVTY